MYAIAVMLNAIEAPNNKGYLRTRQEKCSAECCAGAKSEDVQAAGARRRASRIRVALELSTLIDSVAVRLSLATAGAKCKGLAEN